MKTAEPSRSIQRVVFVPIWPFVQGEKLRHVGEKSTLRLGKVLDAARVAAVRAIATQRVTRPDLRVAMHRFAEAVASESVRSDHVRLHLFARLFRQTT